MCIATLGGDSANQNPPQGDFKHDSKYYLCMQHCNCLVFTLVYNNGIVIGSSHNVKSNTAAITCIAMYRVYCWHPHSFH